MMARTLLEAIGSDIGGLLGKVPEKIYRGGQFLAQPAPDMTFSEAMQLRSEAERERQKVADAQAADLAQAEEISKGNQAVASIAGAIPPDAQAGLLQSPVAVAPAQQGLLGKLPSTLAQNLRDAIIAQGTLEAGMPQLVTAADLDKIRRTTPATVLAQMEKTRAAREAEQRDLELRGLSLSGKKDDSKSDEANRRKAYAVVSSVDDVLSIIDEHPYSVGMGSLLKFIPTTKANLVDKKLDTIKAQIGFAELQAMRDASRTGGALGQVTERELQFLQRTIDAIEPDLSAEDLRRNLNNVRQVMLAIANGTQDPRMAEVLGQSVQGGDTVRTYNPATGEFE